MILTPLTRLPVTPAAPGIHALRAQKKREWRRRPYVKHNADWYDVHDRGRAAPIVLIDSSKSAQRTPRF
jgi:hypothetical protein